MAQIIGMTNQKGGVGKTTISINVAWELTQVSGSKVLLVDADPQASALDWVAVRESPIPFTVIGLPKPFLHKELPKIAHNFDYILIDGPPRVTDITRSMTMVCDALVIPVQPSPYDVWAANDTVALIEEARIVKPELDAFFVMNRVIKNTVISKDVLSALQESTIPTSDTMLYNRVAYCVSVQEGRTVGEMAHLLPKKEIADLTNDILTRLLTRDLIKRDLSYE